jgi:hypothetical protein
MTPGRRGRRICAAPGVTYLRLRARPVRALLVGLGVALALAFVVDVAGGSVVSEDLALQQALGALSPADRVARVSWSGQVATGGFRALDRAARRALRTLTGEPIDTTVELADVQLGRGLVKLGATNSLAEVVHLETGRLPAACGRLRCEVVQLGGAPVRRIDGFGVHLVVVGHGRLASTVPFGEGGLATQPATGGERPEPVLLTSSVSALASLAPLVEINRNYSWSASLEPSSVHVWNVDRVFAAEARVEARLTEANPQFSFTGPDDALAASQSQSATASHRILLVGSSAALLLLAFLSITAGGLRRDARAELRRLVTRGATRAEQWGFLLSEAAIAVLPGALAGLVLGALVDALLAHQLSVPVGDALRHGIVTPTAALVAAGATVAALVVVLLALRRPEDRAVRGVRAADMAAVGAVVALGLVVAGSQSRTGSLGGGSAAALAATPLLASFAFSVLLARVLEPAVRLAVGAAGRGPSSLLLALLTLYRAPRRTAGIVGFLAVSTGLAAFALSYRATLATSSAQSAAYDVPLDYTLDSGPALVAPGDVATLAEYRSLAPGVDAWPILRQTAEVAESGATPASPDVIGVPATAFPEIHGWRSDFSPDSPATLGRLLRPTRPVQLAGATIPEDATRLELRARSTGAVVQLVLVVLTRSGGADQLRPPLTAGRARLLGVAVPAADRGGRLIALQLELPSAVQRSEAHHTAEGRSASSGFAGVLQLGRLTADEHDRRVVLSSFAGWIGRNGVTPHARAGGQRIRFDITTSEEAIFRPRQPFDTRRLPVLASPDVASAAGPGGALELNFGDQVVPARLVAVARRFPTTQDNGDSFVIADESSLASALGANDLPTAIPDELWLSTPGGAGSRVAASLRAPPFSSLAISSRAAIAAELRDAPLARGIVVSLLAAAAVALALALVGLALATAGFVRDEADTLFDLESQGVGPRALRASLRWRALGLAGLGLPAGIGLGFAMLTVTGRLLALDATLTVPDPPLQRVTPWALIAGSACAFALLSAALVELVLRVAHRGAAAGRGATGENWAA